MGRCVLAAVAAIVLGLAGAARAQEVSRSTWDGVFSAAQAERGATAYAQNCQVCHGPALQGVGEAKPLTGPEFLGAWNGLTLGDLFDRIRKTMPIDRPGALTREAYADILAYLLKFNGFPAGAAELDKRTETLATIRLDAFKPAAAVEADPSAPAPGRNDAPNPYVAQPGFLKLPPGRTMGSSSAVALDSRGHVWVVDRCGANSCAGSDLDPILEFDGQGRFVKAFGKGRFLFPHGLFIDRQDRLWVTDQRGADGKGAQVSVFDRTGAFLFALGKPGGGPPGPDTFSEPTATLVAPNGVVFVADGHSGGKGPARIVKFDSAGRYLGEFGVRGPSRGQLEVPHSLAMDSRGRLFVADRWNNRISIFEPDGKLVDVWTQFGRPSAVAIDADDTLYVSDSESRAAQGYGHNPGWKRGIRIGSARTGAVTGFIPDTLADPEPESTSGAEGLAVDGAGVIYGAQVLQKAVVRYVRKP